MLVALHHGLQLVLSNTIRIGDKLPDESGEVPKPNRVIDGSILGHGIVSLLDGKLARWSSASCVPKRKRKKRKEERIGDTEYHM